MLSSAAAPVAAAGWLCLAWPVQARGEKPIRPASMEIEVDVRQAALGETLFHDRHLPVDVMSAHPPRRRAPPKDQELVIRVLPIFTGEDRGKPLDLAAAP